MGIAFDLRFLECSAGARKHHSILYNRLLPSRERSASIDPGGGGRTGKKTPKIVSSKFLF